MMRCRQRAALFTVGNYIRILGRWTAILDTAIAALRLFSSVVVPETDCNCLLVAMGDRTSTVSRVE